MLVRTKWHTTAAECHAHAGANKLSCGQILCADYYSRRLLEWTLAIPYITAHINQR